MLSRQDNWISSLPSNTKLLSGTSWWSKWCAPNRLWCGNKWTKMSKGWNHSWGKKSKLNYWMSCRVISSYNCEKTCSLWSSASSRSSQRDTGPEKLSDQKFFSRLGDQLALWIRPQKWVAAGHLELTVRASASLIWRLWIRIMLP